MAIITFGAHSFTDNGNMINFVGGFSDVLDLPVTTYNSNSRNGGIAVIDDVNSVRFAGAYTILGKVVVAKTVYDGIKSLQGTVNTLSINGTIINNVILVRVSDQVHIGGGVISCNCTFEKSSA